MKGVDYNPVMSERPKRNAEPAQPPPPVTGPAPVLSSAQRSALRAQAHGLAPVVMIGDAGLTDSVAAETDRALGAHGLIKVRVLGDDREARQAMALALSERLGCALVQSIGKLLVLWRPLPPSAIAQTPIRRRVATAPKKLAAEGKPAPARRARPGVPRAEAPKPAPKRKAPPRHARTVGPGSRTVRGAFDPTITPVIRTAAGTASDGRDDNKRPAAARKASVGTAGTRNRSGIGMAKRAPSPARPPASGARRSSAGTKAGTNVGSSARPASGKSAAPARKATAATGSGRPGPRSRAGRRGP